VENAACVSDADSEIWQICTSIGYLLNWVYYLQQSIFVPFLLFESDAAGRCS